MKKIVEIYKKTVVFLLNLIKLISNWFEQILIQKRYVKILSLVITLFIFFFVKGKLNFTDSSAEIIYDQKVHAEYNREIYVVEGIPESVDITLIGSYSDIALAKQIGGHEVYVNLSDLKSGTHEVELKYRKVVNTINYKLDPSKITVVIHNKQSTTKDLDIELINKDKMDPRLSITEYTIDRDKVIVKGTQPNIEKVAFVKALLDLSNIKKAGTHELENTQLIAYDSDGNAVDVEVVPSNVKVEIKVESINKKVPIIIIPKGTPKEGLAISYWKLNYNEVTIYGDMNILNNIESIPVEIDVTNLAKNRTFTKDLTKPVGVGYMSINQVEILVELGETTTKVLEGIPVEVKNLGSDLKVSPVLERDSKVDVTVTGAENVLSAITNDSVEAYVDLTNLGVGTHTVPVIVLGKEKKATYQSSKETIVIEITK